MYENIEYSGLFSLFNTRRFDSADWIAVMMFKLFYVIAAFVAVVLSQEDHQEDENFANFLHSNDHIHNKE